MYKKANEKVYSNKDFESGKCRTVDLFLLFIIIGDLLAAITFFYTDGKSFNSLIWNGDTYGIFPDFFETLMNAEHLKPYSDGAIYPAFVYVVLYPLSRLLNVNIHEIGFTSASITQRGSIIGFYFFFLFTALYLIILFKIAEFNLCEKIGVFVALFMSPGYIYLIDRGNIVILTAVLIGGFLCLYIDFNDNKKKPIQGILSLLLLCSAVCMKLYPILFGLFLLRRKDWKGILKSIVLFAVLFLIPFLAIKDEHPIMCMLDNLLSLNGGNTQDTRGFGYGYMVSITTIAKAITNWLGLATPSYLYTVIDILILASVCYVTFMSNKTWKQLFAITVSMIVLPGFSWLYNCIYLFIPLMYFFKEEHFINKNNVVYLILFILCTICVPYGYVMKSLPGANKMSIGTLMEFSAMILMILILVIETTIINYKASSHIKYYS